MKVTGRRHALSVLLAISVLKQLPKLSLVLQGHLEQPQLELISSLVLPAVQDMHVGYLLRQVLQVKIVRMGTTVQLELSHHNNSHVLMELGAILTLYSLLQQDALPVLPAMLAHLAATPSMISSLVLRGTTVQMALNSLTPRNVQLVPIIFLEKRLRSQIV